ncbi:MAG: hypothetical protein K0S65_5452, partial [Labilithrix sp.]|nr:hypothetical protein [Labilithrix sp.]
MGSDDVPFMPPVIRLESVEKTYAMGELEVRAL